MKYLCVLFRSFILELNLFYHILCAGHVDGWSRKNFGRWATGLRWIRCGSISWRRNCIDIQQEIRYVWWRTRLFNPSEYKTLLSIEWKVHTIYYDICKERATHNSKMSQKNRFNIYKSGAKLLKKVTVGGTSKYFFLKFSSIFE